MKKWLTLLGVFGGIYYLWQRNKPLVSVNDQVVVITGASAGIGRATAHAFARGGAKVVLVARRADILAQVQDEIAQYNRHPSFVVTCDVSQDEEIENMVQTVIEKYGHIDVLISNAGISHGGYFSQMTPQNIRQHLDINQYANIRLAQLIMPIFQQQGFGHFIIVSSVASILTAPGQVIYATTKAGINALADGLRREFAGTGARVSTVMPGWTDTEMIGGVTRDDLESAGLSNVLMPIASVDQVADEILRTFVHNKSIVVVGIPSTIMVTLARISPQITDWVWATFFDRERVLDTLSKIK